MKLRRSMMFIPGNNPSLMRDANIYGADSLMFDLEDSVKITEKDAARFLVYGALTSINYGNTEIVVRVNPLNTPYGKDDVDAMVKAGVDIIRLPKSETAQDIIDMDEYITECEKKYGITIGKTKMMAAIESALGVLNALDIARASERLVAMALGAEDYVTDLKTTRSVDGIELLYARSHILLACRAANLMAIDTVYSDVNNEEGFIKEATLIKQLGFDGKSVINPRQIEPLVKVFTPTQKEIDHAKAVINAIHDAEVRGLGVISLNGKMVDKPVVDRANRVIALAKAGGLLEEEGDNIVL